MRMLIGLSGTPGSGKTSAGRELEAMGYQVHHLSDLIKRWDRFGPPDGSGSVNVDVDELRDLLVKWADEQEGTTILDGHLSYLAPVDAALILRVDPDVIGSRLSVRDYTSDKVRENMEAESVSVVLIEAVMEMEEKGGRVFERDVTGLTVRECADWIDMMIKALAGEDLKTLVSYRPGKVDWTEVISGWY